MKDNSFKIFWLAAFLLSFSLILVLLKSFEFSPSKPQPPIQPEPTVNEQTCAIENCHGLDIECGSNPPDFCTEIYMIGDFCRQFAECKVVAGKCQLVESPKFTRCKACVEACSDMECESRCRDQF